MEARLPPSIPLPLPQDVLNDIVDKAKDWALMHGAGMRSKTNFSKDSLNFAPFALLPSTFSRKEFEKAVALQPVIELMHKVHAFLEESLKNTIKVDEFTGGLYKIYEQVRKEGFGQCINLGLLRSDYLPQSYQDNIIKQVEVNTIASSFGGISSQLFDFHRFVLQELGHPELLTSLPENSALRGLCSGMLEAGTIKWQLI